MSSNWAIVVKFANGDSRMNGLPCVIGRSPAKELLKGRDSNWSAISVDHKYLSRVHAEITMDGGDDDATPPEDATDCICPTVSIRQLGKNLTFFGDSAIGVSQGITKSFTLPSPNGVRIFFPAELQLPEFCVQSAQRNQGANQAQPQQSFSLVMSAADDDGVAVEASPAAPQKFALLDKAMSMMAGTSSGDNIAQPASKQSGHISTVPAPPAFVPQAASPVNLTIGKGWGFSSATPAAAAPTSAAQVVPSTSLPPVVATVPQNVVAPSTNYSVATSSTAAIDHHKMGFWEWKAAINADDTLPSSWKRYVKAQADVLEAAFRAEGGSNPTLNLDATYAVCFDDKDYGMVQYRRDDPSRWRPIRRRGGDPVQRPNKKRVECIQGPGGAQPKKKKRRAQDSESDSFDKEESYDKDSWLVDDSDETFSESISDSDDASFASQSSSDAGEKRKRRANKKRKAYKKRK